MRRLLTRDPASVTSAVQSPSLSRRRFLQGAAGLSSLVVLGAWPDLVDAATQPALTAAQLPGAMAALPKTGYVHLPGGGHAAAADLRAAAAAFAVGDASAPDPASNPVAALGVLCAVCAWSGYSGLLNLAVTLPATPLKPLRLALPTLPGGESTDIVASAMPPGLVVRPTGSLILVGTLSGKRLLVALEDPARTVANHPRLELAVLRATDLAPLLAVRHAKLNATGTSVLLASGSQVSLRPLASSLATRLLSAAGAVFVDQVPPQPLGATSALLTVDPIVPRPDTSVVSSYSRVRPASDGRVLALDSTGTAMGRAEYIGGTPAWDWLGSDGVDWTLRELADAIGWRIGNVMQGNIFGDPLWDTVNRQQFNLSNLAGPQWRDIQATPTASGPFGWWDGQVATAQQNAAQIMAGHLVWVPGYPDWLTSATWTPEDLEGVLRNHVTTVVKHFKGVVTTWIVVNEFHPLSWGKDDVLQRVLGPKCVDIAFATARAADPAAVLIYNDTDNEIAAGPETPLTLAIVDRLRPQGLIDGVGLQMHLDGSHPPAKADVVATMQGYGVPVYVTEFDVDIRNGSGSQDERFAVQAAIYRDMLDAALESGVCKSFALFGIGDKYSWLEDDPTHANDSPLSNPTPFNDNLQPKPAYFAVLDQLKARAGLA